MNQSSYWPCQGIGRLNSSVSLVSPHRLCAHVCVCVREHFLHFLLSYDFKHMKEFQEWFSGLYGLFFSYSSTVNILPGVFSLSILKRLSVASAPVAKRFLFRL